MALQEIRHSFRTLRKSPGFTTVAALSLALGIGANSAVFSLADAILLRPLPIAESGSVFTISTTTPENPFGAVSYPDYRDFCDKSRSFDGLVAYQFSTFGVTASARDVPQMRLGMLVSDNFFRVLGVEPTLGRGFLADEGKVAERDAIAVLGHDFWKNQFGGDRSVIGRTIRLNGIDFNVVGVVPERFTGMDQYVRPAMFVPATMAQRLMAARENPLEKRDDRSFRVKGRLKSGVSQEGAQAELATVWKNLQAAYPELTRNRNVGVKTELQARVGQSLPDAILISFLMALVGLVLIIACANVANLLLARSRARSREIAIRIAVGAGRLRLIRQLLIESLILSLIGGALGLIFAYGGIRFLQRVEVPTDLPIVIGIQLDHRVLLFSLFAAVVSALFFGLVPALQSTKTDLVPALKATDRGVTTRRRTIGRNILVGGQVALSMVLLVAAGILLDATRKSIALNPGFRTDHLMTMEFDTALVRYTEEQTRDFYRNLRDRAGALPGVRSVTMTTSIPFSPNSYVTAVIPEGYQLPKGTETVGLAAGVVGEHYFDTMKTGIVRGRAFTADDKAGSRRVVIVNQEFANVYWPRQDPIGKRLRLNDRNGPWAEVVGVARTGKYFYLAEPPTSYLYLPFAQEQQTRMSLIVETYGDPAAIAAPLRDVVRALDANQPIYNVTTMSRYYERREISAVWSIMQMVGTMGLLGLTLALVGLYGLIAYSVSRRTHEIGIRMAIGANKRDVLKMVLRQGLLLTAAGIVVGGVASFAVARLLAIGLVGLGAPNPATFVVVPIALLLITMAACYIPARRASRIDPIQALRDE